MRQRGFTLIELLVVISIIGILASVIMASLSAGREKAHVTAAKAELHALRNAVLMLNADTGRMPGGYPTNLCRGASNAASDGNGLVISNNNAGLMGQVASKFPRWNGPYMVDLPLDPWGNEYIYDSYYNCSGSPTDCPSGPTATVIHSGGPNESGVNGYDSDNISVEICR